MESLIPATANIAFWINAKVAGKISDSDFANACESLLGIHLAIPHTRAQVSSLECALDHHHILRQSLTGVWEIVERDNRLVAYDPAAARTALLTELEQATTILQSIATLGSRSDIDEQLDSMYSPHLPPLRGNYRESLEMALRVRLVCQRALASAEVPSSPSAESSVRSSLRLIDDLALSLICAIASNA